MDAKESVVLITVDCLRSDHVGCYGYERPTTPNIDALADRATLYENSYANSPGTRWALQTIHTGVHTNQIDGLGIPDGVQSLASLFQKQGYSTGGFAKNGFLTRDYGYDSGFDEFVDVADFRSDEHIAKKVGAKVDGLLQNDWLRSVVLEPLHRVFQSTQNSDGGFRPAITDEELCTRALQWIKTQQNSEKPFFAWVHLMDAHTPYARWDDHLASIRGDTDIRHIINPHDEIVEEKMPPQAVIDAYDAGIRSADEQIGRMIAALDDDTTIAITGDHGEEFGRYNPFHNASLQSSMTQVPLLVRSPDLDTERVSTYPVQHLDIAPTLADSAGLTPPSEWQGESLHMVERENDDSIYLAVSDELGIRKGDWKLIRHEVDDLFNTPHHGDDTDDVSDKYPDKFDELADLLDEHIDWAAKNKVGMGRESLEDDSSNLSDSTRDNLEELGYLER